MYTLRDGEQLSPGQHEALVRHMETALGLHDAGGGGHMNGHHEQQHNGRGGFIGQVGSRPLVVCSFVCIFATIVLVAYTPVHTQPGLGSSSVLIRPTLHTEALLR